MGAAHDWSLGSFHGLGSCLCLILILLLDLLLSAAYTGVCDVRNETTWNMEGENDENLKILDFQICSSKS